MQQAGVVDGNDETGSIGGVRRRLHDFLGFGVVEGDRGFHDRVFLGRVGAGSLNRHRALGGGGLERCIDRDVEGRAEITGDLDAVGELARLRAVRRGGTGSGCIRCLRSVAASTSGQCERQAHNGQKCGNFRHGASFESVAAGRLFFGRCLVARTPKALLCHGSPMKRLSECPGVPPGRGPVSRRGRGRSGPRPGHPLRRATARPPERRSTGASPAYRGPCGPRAPRERYRSPRECSGW